MSTPAGSGERVAGTTRGGEHQTDDSDRHVHQEDRPPRRAGDVRVEQDAAEQLSGDDGNPPGRGVEPDRAAAGRPVERRLERREYLRHDHGRRGALQYAGRDEHADAGGDAAQQRRQREAGHPEQEHPPAADRVPEPAADHE
jgi:hypothetical protein